VIDASDAAVTLNTVALLVTPPDIAWMVVDPMASDCASPLALIVATAGDEELHVDELVRFCVLPSL
jgi:hypothetical protein